MIIPELLTESLILNNIDADYINSSEIKINRITLQLSGNSCRFGTVKFQFANVERFLSTLDQECLINISKQQKAEILSTYSFLEHKLLR